MNADTSPYNPKIDGEPTLYDTTLRDGEQTPGVAFDTEAKFEIATRLDRIGVPEIELGFPAVSSAEREAVAAIASAGLDAETLALARTDPDDIDAAVDCGVDRVTIVAPASDAHLDAKTDWEVGGLLDRVGSMVRHAAARDVAVTVSAEDATRTPVDRLRELARTAERAGASRIHLPDTTGGASPTAVARLVTAVGDAVADDTEVGVHCHDDCGLAVANTLAGLAAGADVGAVTVTGIGERAGNAPLGAVVVALEAIHGVETGIDTTGLSTLARTVAERSGLEIPATQPVVGEHSFVHESGIHVDALLEDPATYEGLDPAAVGQSRRIALGKHSGSTARALADRAEDATAAREDDLR